jgi:hypothetical protein
MNAVAKFANGFRRALGLETAQPKPPELLVPAPKPMVGLFSMLDTQQQKQALTYVGNHNFGAQGETRSKACQ